ncbi:MAG: P-loop NTPase fold protein [Gammaproteobacteria bacterium]|nr:P-loop NTPase fold protein [Gammaproteobacteria bacterium]
MFDADRPITNSQQDRLGRAVFAKYLARCMLDHNTPESLVIGLHGGWGSGKTSLINLILEELRYASNNMFDDEKPIILNFSPWSYSGQGQLIYGFFRRLSSELRRAPYLDNAEEIIHLLELYVSFFTHQPIPKSMRLKRRLLSQIQKPLSGKQEAYAWESGRDPTLVKMELNELLKNQKHKIIIIIDNISRIEPGEINQILQIVKSMGDYFNTIYLLAFDKVQVLDAIDQMHPGEGGEYLEKLVQLPFEVPPISKQDIENLLLDKLLHVIELVPEDTWDNTYWADIYYSTLKYFFQSCRDVTRYTNTLSFSYQYVKDVVNPVDFFALTAIEIFAPELFYGLRENKDLFTDLLDNVYAFDEEQIKKDKLRVDEIILHCQSIPADILQKLLMHLFPRLRSMYEPNTPYYHSASLARKNKRVCNPDAFDVYFRLSIPSGYMDESELETILMQANSANSFDQTLSRLNQDDRIVKFLDLMDSAVTEKIPQKNIQHVINALIDCADLFPEGKTTLLSFDSDMRVHRICHQLLRTFSKTEERFAILQEAITKATKSLHIIVRELMIQGQEHIESEDTFLPASHRDLSGEQLMALRNLAVEKIQYWAHNGRLAEHPKLLPILYAWKAWGSEDECREYIMKMIQDEKGLLAFLGATLQLPVEQVMTKLAKNPDWIESLNNITYFIPTDDVLPAAKAIFEGDGFEQLREKEQVAVLMFLDLTNAKTTKLIPKTTF